MARRPRDAQGARRLDNPADFVRIEIEAALARDIRVIPVLLDGAEMPEADALPDSLRSLPRRQSVRISHERFAPEVDTLANALKRAFGLLEAVAVTPQVAQPFEEPVSSAAASGSPRADIIFDASELILLGRQAGVKQLYIRPNIPSHKEHNARSKTQLPIDEMVVLLLDMTRLGSAKDCVVFGKRRVYQHCGFGQISSFDYRYLRDHEGRKNLLGFRIGGDIDFPSPYFRMGGC